MAQYEYRRYTDSDKSRLRLFLESWFDGRKDRDTMADHIIENISPRSTIILAKHGEDVIGYAHCVENRRGIHFKQAATHPDYRSQGVFTMLLTKVLEFAGDRAITAEINPSRRHYDTMYRAGFRIRGATDEGLAVIERPRKRRGLGSWRRGNHSG